MMWWLAFAGATLLAIAVRGLEKRRRAPACPACLSPAIEELSSVLWRGDSGAGGMRREWGCRTCGARSISELGTSPMTAEQHAAWLAGNRLPRATLR